MAAPLAAFVLGRSKICMNQVVQRVNEAFRQGFCRREKAMYWEQRKKDKQAQCVCVVRGERG